MPATGTCTPNCCDDVNTVNTPGAEGQSAFTTLTANLTIPAIGDPVVVAVGNTDWMAVGQPLFLSDGSDFGHFVVLSINSSISVTLEFSGQEGDASPAAVIGSGGAVVCGAVALTEAQLNSLLASILTGVGALTDNTGGVASDTIAAGVGITTLTVPLSSLATGLSTGALDLLTNYVPGFAFKLLSFDWVTTIVGAGGGASQTFNLEIGSTNVTGGTLNPTLASTNTIGAITAGSAITANNTGTASDTLSIEMAGGGTVFSSGSGYFVIKLQNLDTVNSVASLSAKINAIRAALIS